jgi:predicted dehydrogenase
LSNNIKNKVLLVGSGNIGYDYVEILRGFKVDIDVVGRSYRSRRKFNHRTGLYVYDGIQNYINKNPKPPKYAIVAVNEHQLSKVTLSLLDYGVKNILLEKPGGLSISELTEIKNKSNLKSSNVHIGYNRRFYKSVEWSHDIDFSHYTKKELERFFLCNSSHVVDLVFHLFGKPKILNSYTNGSLKWHPSASIFSGSGKTEQDVLFTYNANWSSAGRWGVEIILNDCKLILRPLEKLFIQRKGSLEIEEVNLFKYDNLDYLYKPGLFNEVNFFLHGATKNLCTIDEQIINFDWYYKIANYKEEIK